MFTTAGLKEFHAAAHSSLDVLLAHLATMHADLLVTELPGFARPNIRDQMFHTIACEIFWIHGLQLLPMPKLSADDYVTVESLAHFKRRAMMETIEYLDRQTEDELNRVLPRVPERWLGPPRSPAFIVHHVLTHAYHHKGQVVAMCRLLGHPAPDTDYQRG
jgi:uncharacterized damage-inducible protein DinB